MAVGGATVGVEVDWIGTAVSVGDELSLSPQAVINTSNKSNTSTILFFINLPNQEISFRPVTVTHEPQRIIAQRTMAVQLILGQQVTRSLCEKLAEYDKI